MTTNTELKFTIETTNTEEIEDKDQAVILAAEHAPCTLIIERAGATCRVRVNEGTPYEELRRVVDAHLAAFKAEQGT